MENFYSQCIFCSNDLTPNEKKGSGDHIFPEFLYGSLCMKDVCVACNSALGRIADHLALEDARIISAAFTLKLPELQAKIRDRGTGKMVDATDGYDIPVRFKKGKPWVVPKRMSDRFFITDERDAAKYLIHRVLKDSQQGLSKDEVERIVRDELMPKYSRLRPGESVLEPRLGTRLRKAPGKIHQEWKVTKKACDRLVAKIGYETAFLTFDRDRLASLPVLRELGAVAMGKGSLSKAVLMYPPDRFSPVNAAPQGPRYHHQVIVWYEDFANIIDIYFFGCVGFRLFLRGDSPAAFGPLKYSDGDLSMASLLTTFEPGERKRKYIFVLPSGSDRVEQYSGDRIL